ncbi:MAG: hypothetical protein IT204_02580 [Fimbriimonadaceae bacterium]|nr:hypothetical protein [Fimbriimonadaceae bacterium]
MSHRLLLLSALLLPAGTLAQVGFQPVLVKAEVTPRVVRPGDAVQVAAWFRNQGVTDRFLKNSYEVLSWVNRLSFGVPLEAHTVRGEVEETRFGSDLHVVVNYGARPVELAAGPVLGQVRLGPWGFAVWSPTFVAVHALAAGGLQYPTPALYTARSLDGQPLASSARVRLYHGCGGPRLGLAGREFVVDREAELRLR